MTQVATRPTLRVESSGRWVRGFVGNTAVVDSKHVKVVYGARRLATYFFPTSDVRMDLLTKSSVADTGDQRWTLSLNGKTIEDIAWTVPDGDELRDLIAFEWRKIERWYEEDEEVFVHPRDPYHRVDVMQSSRNIRVVIDGETVAETNQPRLLFETGIRTRYYIPKVDVRMELLTPTATSTSCPYKGNAVYWTAHVNGKDYSDIVWSYPFTTPECPKIQNLLSFYNEKVDIYVDGELEPKPNTR
jgi:uncharacterized protein (DUF427 family)